MIASAAAGEARAYVNAVIGRYVDLPGTPHRASRQDRRLAGELYRRSVCLAAVEAALLLGAARRALRSKDAPPLAPIRTLHYFLPVLDEVLNLPPDPTYLGYLENRLRPLLKASTSSASTSGQKTALPGGR